jgi:CheY-like chemotaxis protein
MEAIGQLAGGVAHDFNNIVTAILGNVDLMRRQMKRQPVPLDQLATDVDQVEQATERAMALTRQLLTFSRRQPVEPEVVQPARLLGDIEKMLRRLIREDIDLRIVVAPDVAMVRVDTGQLEQVIVNLAVNARDAMPSGGKLTIEAFNVELDADYVASHAGAAAGPHVVFAVSDTGTGIETKVLPRIFEPFFTTKPKDQGTGLGLATVYGIAKRFDGHVTVYTEMGIGTTFKVYLPRSAGQAGRAASGVQAVPVAGGTETLLVCEDDETIRQLMCRVLTERGYQVLSAENSQKGIELAARHEGPIDLLVTDVIMQGMSGGQMAQQLKAQRPNMRILYVSGYTSDVVEQHGVLESGIQFLQKPFTAEDLARRVRELLDSEKI